MKFFIAYFVSGIIILFTSVCCTPNGTPGIIHMSYLDAMDTVYNILDTTHIHPLQDKALYFLIDWKNVSGLKDSFFIDFIHDDHFCQKEIGNKYSSLSIFFYKRSKDTDRLVKDRLKKYLSYCNDDIVVEYLWKDGIAGPILHYESGRIMGSEKIQTK
jgi:hypothetical protein